jgi:hypothetical protein
MLVDLVVVDLGENDLFLDPEACNCRGRRRRFARQRRGSRAMRGIATLIEAIQELVHALATQRDLAADRQAFAQLEARRWPSSTW